MSGKFKKILVVSVLTGFAVVSVFFYVKSLGQNDIPLNSRNDDYTVFSENTTTEQVAHQCSPGDCWIIISGDVYDATSFINYDPRGAERIVPQCGKDAIEACQTQRNTGGSHSSDAQAQLKRLRIGSIRSDTQNTTTTETNSSVQTSGEHLTRVVTQRYPTATLLTNEVNGNTTRVTISVDGQCREIRIRDRSIERNRWCEAV